MDEIFGYFPPVANPPSKRPLLTLLKQGRAFGLGAILATQNPVDLDYKGLANIGTWFLGRLQTDRDKQHVLDGLEGAAQGSSFDRAAMEQTLARLGNRVFLLHNVHEEGASIFESRWAMSYLRGPMTRNQIKTLMDARRSSGRRRSVAAKFGGARGRAHWRCGARGFSDDGGRWRGCEMGSKSRLGVRGPRCHRQFRNTSFPRVTGAKRLFTNRCCWARRRSLR